MAKFDFMSLEESGEAKVEENVSGEIKAPEDNQPIPEKIVEDGEQKEEFIKEGEEKEGIEYEDVEVSIGEDGEEIVTPVKSEEKKTVKKEPYTEAEIQEILKGDGEIDTTRLSPAEQATMKAMQRGFTPKLQEAAELRREVEELRKQVTEATPKEQPADIYQAYDQDPDGVLQYVDSQINELVATGDAAKMGDIRQLESLKYEFNRRDVQKLRQQNTTQSTETSHMTAILSAVPDLATKQQALKDFAITELGYTEEELASETNPSISGSNAVRAITRINTAYDKAQAKITVKKKRRVKKATNVEQPSSVGYEKPDVDELKLAKQTALESGNFKDFFAALGED